MRLVLILLMIAPPMGYMALDIIVRGESAPDYTAPVIALLIAAVAIIYLPSKKKIDTLT